MKMMEKVFFCTVLCLLVALATSSPNPRIYKVARGQFQHHRELDEDPCEEEVSNDRDISNDARARSNVFSRGSKRRRLKIAGKADIGKASGKASGKAKDPSAPAYSASGDFDESNDFGSADDSSPTLSPTGVFRSPVSTCIPTLNPTKTPTPTGKPYFTDPDTTVSTCKVEPDEEGILFDELLHFKYNLYVPPQANQTDAMNLAEMLIHYGLAEEFLTCNFDDDISPDIFAIDSRRNATLSSEECDTTGDPIPEGETVCVVVLSDVNMTAFYPISSWPYEIPNPAIKNATGLYLNFSMARGDFVWDDVIQTVFKGFVDDDNSTGAVGIVVGRGAAAGGSDGVLLGSALTGVAAFCLLLFLMFAVQRRRLQNDGYKGPGDSLGDTPTFSIGSDPGLESLSDGRVQLVLNDEFDFGDDDPELSFHEQPDVHHCNSATCPICGGRKNNGPTFLKTQTQPDDEFHWKQNTRLPARSYDSMDTVNM